VLTHPLSFLISTVDYFLQFFLHCPLCLQSLQLVSLQVALHSVHFLQSALQPAFSSFFLSQQSAFFSAFFLQQSFFSAFLSQHSFLALGLLSDCAFTVVVEHRKAMIIMALTITFFISNSFK